MRYKLSPTTIFFIRRKLFLIKRRAIIVKLNISSLSWLMSTMHMASTKARIIRMSILLRQVRKRVSTHIERITLSIRSDVSRELSLGIVLVFGHVTSWSEWRSLRDLLLRREHRAWLTSLNILLGTWPVLASWFRNWIVVGILSMRGLMRRCMICYRLGS